MALFDTELLLKSVKYLFCMTMANFKAVNIYNILKLSKGRHLTITDNINRNTEKLTGTRNYVKRFFGAFLKSLSFSNWAPPPLSGRKTTKFTPSIELIRSVINKDALCSKVHRGLLQKPIYLD